MIDNTANLGRLFDKAPPHSIEAEVALVGSMVLDWKMIGPVMSIIGGADDFYAQANAAIYNVLVEMFNANRPVDLVQLHEILRDRDMLEQIGGLDYLEAVGNSVPSASSAEYYAQIVRDKSLIRKTIELAGNTLHQAYHSMGTPAGDIIDGLQTAAFTLSDTAAASRKRTIASIGSIMQDAYTALEIREKDSIVGLPTGFYELDDILCGLQKGDLIIVGARPSCGKSGFGLGILKHVCMHANKKAALFSSEMTKEQIGLRMMSMIGNVDSRRIRKNQISIDEFERLANAVAVASESPMLVDDSRGISVHELASRARRMGAKERLELIVVDYLQLLSCPGAKENRQVEVAAISRALKALAGEMNIPIVALCQLNRSADTEKRKPRLSDLRESGAIEQDADVVLLLHREDLAHKADEDYQPTNIAEAIIEKQRMGETGVVKLRFDGPTAQFHSLSHGRI